MKKCNNKCHNTLAFWILVALYDKFDSEMIYCEKVAQGKTFICSTDSGRGNVTP